MPQLPPARLSVELETWTDAHHREPLDDRRQRCQIAGPGGMTLTITGRGCTLLIEVDTAGACLITRVTSDPADEGVELYSGSLGSG